MTLYCVGSNGHFPVGRPLDTLREDASGVSALQHSRNIGSPATFRPMESLIGPPLFPSRAVLYGMSAARDSGPVRDASWGDGGLVESPVPLPKSLSTGPGRSSK